MKLDPLILLAVPGTSAWGGDHARASVAAAAAASGWGMVPARAPVTPGEEDGLLRELPAAADAPVHETATGASAVASAPLAAAGASLAGADDAPANAAADEPPQLPAEVSAVRAAERTHA